MSLQVVRHPGDGLGMHVGHGGGRESFAVELHSSSRDALAGYDRAGLEQEQQH